MKVRGFSQNELARKLPDNIQQKHISEIVNGNRKPGTKILEELAIALDSKWILQPAMITINFIEEFPDYDTYLLTINPINNLQMYWTWTEKYFERAPTTSQEEYEYSCWLEETIKEKTNGRHIISFNKTSDNPIIYQLKVEPLGNNSESTFLNETIFLEDCDTLSDLFLEKRPVEVSQIPESFRESFKKSMVGKTFTIVEGKLLFPYIDFYSWFQGFVFRR